MNRSQYYWNVTEYKSFHVTGEWVRLHVRYQNHDLIIECGAAL